MPESGKKFIQDRVAKGMDKIRNDKNLRPSITKTLELANDMIREV